MLGCGGAFLVCGGIVMPNSANAPEWVKALGYSVFGFYFGVVSVVDDLPRGIGKLISIIRK